MGCTATAIVLLVVVIIGGVASYRRLTGPVPLPESSRLAAEDSVGHAVLRLDPDNPWVRQMFSELSKYSAKDPHATDLFPIEMVWSAHRSSSPAEGHILDLSFSPRGRLFGLMTDIALWRLGRGGQAKFSRVEYGGEGITSFPGTPLPGQIFVRNNSILWASDLDTARRAVDLVVAREKQKPEAIQPAAALALLPDPAAHALVGYISGESGTAARCLALLPGAELDLTEETLAGADLTFQLDASSGDTATGEVVMRFPPGTAEAAMSTAAGQLSRGISSLKWGQVVFATTPSVESSRAVISVEASGLSTVYARLFQEFIRMQRTLKTASEDPNQSSSTFQ